MGGDHGIKTTVPATAKMVRRHADLSVILVGNEKLLKRAIAKQKMADHPRIRIVHASEEVAMDESPALALRNKKDSSMRVAINLVKEGKAQACVSAGNTGALMATSRFVLKTIPGVDRPAIIYPLPTVDEKTGATGRVHMLDLGANVDCSAENLFQFAVMGAIHRYAVDGKIIHPRVALLNIGEEEMKGSEAVKEASKRIGECDGINYIGFVEGNDIFCNKAEVIVCDGFVGNVALKTIEGTAHYIAYHFKNVVKKNLLARLLSLFSLPLLLKLRKKLDSRRYNGASLIGLKGIVVKSHGSADAFAFEHAILEAMSEVTQDIPSQIHHRIADLLGQAQHDS